MFRAEHRINELFRSRSLSIIMVVIALIAAFIAGSAGVVDAIPGFKGLGLPSPNHWLSSPSHLAPVVYLLVSMAMIAINRVFNLLHTLSLVCGAWFMWMIGGCPPEMGQVSGGMLLVVIMLAAWSLLFSAFDDPRATPRVFLTFFLVAAGALTQYGFIAYIPILLMGCGQMRIFNIRTLLAALTGIVTPLWITWGMGWIDFSHLAKPGFDNIFTEFSRPLLVWYLSLTAVTVGMLIGLVAVNVIRVYSYNLITRAMNSLMIVTSIATAVMTAVDFTNMPFYYPMLCCCTAFQLGHYAHFHAGHRSCYIVLGGTMIVYAAFYLWRLILG